MFNLTKRKEASGIDFNDEIQSRGAVGYSTGEGIVIDYASFFADSTCTSDFLKNRRPLSLALVMGESYAIGDVIQNYNPHQADMEKRDHGVPNTTHFSEIIPVAGNGILTAIGKTESQDILANSRASFPMIPHHRICGTIDALYYIYLRCYSYDNVGSVALVYLTNQSVATMLLNSEIPIAFKSRSFNGNREQLYKDIDEMIVDFKINGVQPRLMLLLGEFESEDRQDIAGLGHAESVQFFEPFRNSSFRIGEVSEKEKYELNNFGYRYVMAIAAVGMAIEEVGVNLSDTDVEVSNQIPLEQFIEIKKPLAQQGFEYAMAVSKSTLPMLVAQRQLLLIALIFSIGLAGYRYWSFNNTLQTIQAQIKVEEARAASLKDVADRHNEYKAKTLLIQERTKAINDIRARQLTVRTIVKDLNERVPAGLVFSELNVINTSVTVKGYAPDRSAVSQFATRLGQSFGIFSDVKPFYDDKQDIGSFQIDCLYVGKVPANNNPISNSTQLVVAKEQQ